MTNNSLCPDYPIAALSTPRYKSALAIIRITGNNCIKLFSPFLHNPHIALTEWNPNTNKYCMLKNPTNNQKIDKVMLCVYRPPYSYTGQESIDISMHGGLVGIDMLLNALYTHGFEPAEPGEFTKRAFLNGKIDLTQAEAIHTIIEAHTVEAHSLGLLQLSGSVSDFINNIKHQLIEIAAICSIALDYPEDEIQEPTDIDRECIVTLIEQLSQSIKSYDLSKKHQEGAVVMLAGLTNAGKSSLFNALLKEERSIVSNTHGTTRDYIESQVILKNIPFRLYDTAGLRNSNEHIEHEGIQRSYKLLQSTDIMCYIIDSTLGIQDKDIAELTNIYTTNPNLISHTIIVWNKIDSSDHSSVPNSILIPTSNQNITLEKIIATSTKNLDNIHRLQETIHSIIDTENSLFQEDLTVISSLRQKQFLQDCKNALIHVLEGLDEGQPIDMISLDIGLALSSLGEITGEVSNEDILDVMFSNFCVGK